MKKLSVVVPCFNEQETVLLFHRTVKYCVSGIPDYETEYVFVNDGSTDNTLSRLQELKDRNNGIIVVNFSRNFGKEAALYAGLSIASGDLVAVMDADLQDPPDILPDMVGYIENEGYDVVYTRRRNRDGEPPVRSFFSRLFYKAINRMSEVEIIDGARDYRVMRRAVVESILSLQEKCRFSKGLFMWVGFRSKLIEFDHRDRAAGTTKWSFRKLFLYAVEGIVSFTTIPLRIASFLGIGISFFSFLFLIYIVIKNTIFKNPVSGWASMVSIVLFLGGIQLTVLGIIGEYIGHIFHEVKSRPLFVIRDIYRSEDVPKKEES